MRPRKPRRIPMVKSFIAWIPFIILLGVFVIFKVTSFANRHYPVFLILLICFGLLLPIIYKFAFRTNSTSKPDKKG